MDTLFKLLRAASSAGIAAILGILPGLSFSQTFTGTGGPIPDNGTPAYFHLPVTGVTPPAMDTVYGLESVEINIAHTWDEDLLVELISPNGTVIILTDGIGGSLNNYTQTVFTDDANLSIFAGTPPYTGNFRPMENIGYQNTGQPANGTWDLRITDKFTGDAGTLLNWTIIFSSNPGGLSSLTPPTSHWWLLIHTARRFLMIRRSWPG